MDGFPIGNVGGLMGFHMESPRLVLAISCILTPFWIILARKSAIFYRQAGIISCLLSANERRRYSVTPSLIGWRIQLYVLIDLEGPSWRFGMYRLWRRWHDVADNEVTNYIPRRHPTQNFDCDHNQVYIENWQGCAYRWLEARLWYLQCISNGDTTVLN